MNMKRARTGPGNADVERLRCEEEKLRTRRVRLLRARLARLRAQVLEVEAELRRAGVSGEELGAARTNWSQVLDQMPQAFTVAQLHAATGANQNLMSSVLNRWVKAKRIVRVERGMYRKPAWKTWG